MWTKAGCACSKRTAFTTSRASSAATCVGTPPPSSRESAPASRARDAAADLGAPLVSVGVDSWGVDYALVDADGLLVEDPVCYRDERTDGAMEQVFGVMPRAEIYARTGIQFHQFNTLYQLWMHVREGLPARATHLLLIPDFCHHALCGSLVSERTNASTTQLVDARTGR